MATTRIAVGTLANNRVGVPILENSGRPSPGGADCFLMEDRSIHGVVLDMLSHSIVAEQWTGVCVLVSRSVATVTPLSSGCPPDGCSAIFDINMGDMNTHRRCRSLGQRFLTAFGRFYRETA